ncbi:hypothetical protein GCM10010123_21050 [Pilimelia anulata]|uniref:N-acetyltransferase domain-containing protein n=1 Tax=Pilimelia anulata TaxID=53371 RepID=A0A8J3B9I5_9ACTN|nr:GNAT family N-acetyltransferase [Pilimelia anulata]GGJ90950.1 hypothetical protein GCM10010123_21050 [Pilimelia anulata]
MSDVVIRRVTAADAAAVRAVRLEMLADSPDAYLETAAAFAARSDAELAALTAERAGSDRVAQFVAVHRGRFVATAAGAPTPHDPAAVTLFAVYVAPGHRGTGVLGGLVDALAGWARSIGRPHLVLEVVTGNDRAERAYAKLGFVGTGELLPHPTKPGETEIRLRRPA